MFQVGLEANIVLFLILFPKPSYFLQAEQSQISGLRVRRLRLDPPVGIFSLVFLFVCDETMSNCNQSCWIDWNSAVLGFKSHFYIGV